MKRVVVTGMGIISCLGNDCDSVAHALRAGQSGIKFIPQYAEMGMRSHVAGAPSVDIEAAIDRKARRFMGDAAAFAFLAAKQAIEDAQISDDLLSNPKVGLVAGSGGASSANQVLASDLLREKGLKKVGPYMVTRTMSSTVSACLATTLKITGMNYSISSACATSAHCIGHAMEMIQLGKQDVVLAGGGEELDWTLSSLFDAMGALSTRYNDSPERASRPYDRDRDGFVIAGGAGMLILESLEHALARNARIYAELVGYGRTSDGADMVAPSPAGPARCMKQALATVDTPIDYINAHGTSTPKGDLSELSAVRMAFPKTIPPVSSTKSMSGHSLGATGAQEAIYSLLMQRDGFIAPTINVENLDEAAQGIDIVTETREARLNTVLSNSFGFGGTNATLVFKRW
ncbi:MAG: beta-ketoacyl-ACP synthase I, partial [Gammaproteobacteria bacterium]